MLENFLQLLLIITLLINVEWLFGVEAGLHSLTHLLIIILTLVSAAEVEAEAALAHSLLYLCLLLRLKLSLTRVHHVTHVAVHALAFFLLILLLADSHDLSHLLLV